MLSKLLKSVSVLGKPPKNQNSDSSDNHESSVSDPETPQKNSSKNNTKESSKDNSNNSLKNSSKENIKKTSKNSTASHTKSSKKSKNLKNDKSAKDFFQNPKISFKTSTTPPQSKDSNSTSTKPNMSSQFNFQFNAPDIPEYKLGKTEQFHYNFCWLLGRRQTQEDAHMAESLGNGCYIFGIFDGHGNSVVSNKVAQVLPKFVKEEMKNKNSADIENIDWIELVNDVFQKIDKLQSSVL